MFSEKTDAAIAGAASNVGYAAIAIHSAAKEIESAARNLSALARRIDPARLVAIHAMVIRGEKPSAAVRDTIEIGSAP